MSLLWLTCDPAILKCSSVLTRISLQIELSVKYIRCVNKMNNKPNLFSACRNIASEPRTYKYSAFDKLEIFQNNFCLITWTRNRLEVFSNINFLFNVIKQETRALKFLYGIISSRFITHTEAHTHTQPVHIEHINLKLLSSPSSSIKRFNRIKTKRKKKFARSLRPPPLFGQHFTSHSIK